MTGWIGSLIPDTGAARGDGLNPNNGLLHQEDGWSYSKVPLGAWQLHQVWDKQ